MRNGMADEPDLTHGLFVPVFDPVGLVLLEGRREGVVARAVVLRDEVEVRDLCRLGRTLERGLPGAADRRRRKAGDLVRVVRRIDLEVLERGPEEIRVREAKSLERRVRRETREHRVLPLPDDRCFQKLLDGDRGEGLVHGGGGLAQAPAFDDPQDRLLARGLLEDARELARRERRRDRVRAGLKRRLTAGVVEDEREGESGTDEALILEVLGDLAGGLSARDDEAARFGVRILRRIRLHADAVGDEPPDEFLFEQRVVLLDLRDDRVFRDGAAEDDAADDQTDDQQNEDEWTGRGALTRGARPADPHQRASCARKSSRRMVAAPASMSLAPRISASLEVWRSSYRRRGRPSFSAAVAKRRTRSAWCPSSPRSVSGNPMTSASMCSSRAIRSSSARSLTTLRRTSVRRGRLRPCASSPTARPIRRSPTSSAR